MIHAWYYVCVACCAPRWALPSIVVAMVALTARWTAYIAQADDPNTVGSLLVYDLRICNKSRVA